MKLISLLKKTMIIISMMYIAVGILLFVNNESSMTTIMQILVVGSLIAGLLSMVRYFLNDVKRRYRSSDFVVGSLLIAIAGLIYFAKEDAVNMSGKILALAIIVSGIHKIQDMFDLRALGIKATSLYLFGFFICTGLGALLLFDVVTSDSLYKVLLGLGMCICGISDICSNFFVASGLVNYNTKNEVKEIKEDRIIKEEKQEKRSGELPLE